MTTGGLMLASLSKNGLTGPWTLFWGIQLKMNWSAWRPLLDWRSVRAHDRGMVWEGAKAACRGGGSGSGPKAAVRHRVF
jgi:hypothetical protein